MVRGMMHGFDYGGYRRTRWLLLPAANHMLGLEDGKKRFFDVMRRSRKAYSLCWTLDEAAELRLEIAFFHAIRPC